MKNQETVKTICIVDYRKLRLNNLNSDTFKHLKLLLFWPIFGAIFWYVEKLYPVANYYPMHCKLDDLIPFCEWFIIPYLFWFVYMVGMHIYTLLWDVEAFKQMMSFILITYGITIVIYFLFPTCQQLRPTGFRRDNLLIQLILQFYQFDTNTNVCPSLHVIGSAAVMEAGLHAKTIHSKGIKAAIAVACFIISISTVFMKQHSILDVFAATMICLLAHKIVYSNVSPSRKKRAAYEKA